MSVETIKKRILQRKNVLSRLSKRKPSDAMKARIAKNTSSLQTLRTKLKIAARNAKVQKPAEKPFKTKVKGKVAVKPTTPVPKERSGEERAHRRVTIARKAYTQARLNNLVSPAKLESLKHTYTSAFKSYMGVMKDNKGGKSTSSDTQIAYEMKRFANLS